MTKGENPYAATYCDSDECRKCDRIDATNKRLMLATNATHLLAMWLLIAIMGVIGTELLLHLLGVKR